MSLVSSENTREHRGAVRLSRRSIIGFVVTTLITAGLLVVLFVRLLAAGQQTVGNQATTLIVGQHAPDFTVTTWSNPAAQTIHLASLRGKPVVVNFYASWCQPCQEEAPVLEAAYQKYAPQGVVFVGIAFEDQPQDSAAFLKQYGVTYPVAPDTTGNIAVAYGVTAVPETAFINRAGVVTYKWGGALDDGRLATQIQNILR